MCPGDGIGPVFAILSALSIRNGLAGPATAGATGQRTTAGAAGALVEGYLATPGVPGPGSPIRIVQN
jgi:hypothetical protein